MDRFAPAAAERSRSGTPANSRFTTQAATPEDLLKEQTVGLVHLNDFRKRRAEALERKDRAASNVASGASTPQDGLVFSCKLPQEIELIFQVQCFYTATLVKEEAKGSSERKALVRVR